MTWSLVQQRNPRNPVIVIAQPVVTTVWNPVRLDGGGFVTWMEIAADGTRFARTDTAGAWVWAPGATKWTQVVNHQSMPSSGTVGKSPDNSFGNFYGVCAIAIATSNTQRFYMYYTLGAGNLTEGYVWSSPNRGTTWARTAGFSSLPADANAQGNPSPRLNSPYLRVDPANENVVLLGTRSTGVQKTADGGATWSQISTGTIPAGSSSQGNLIQFDSTGGTSGGKTQRIYATSYGSGLYKSTDGGTTWAIQNSTGMPTTFTMIFCDQNGVLWVVDDVDAGNHGNLWKFVPNAGTGTWTKVIATSSFPPSQISAVTVDPSNGAHVFATDTHGCLFFSTNTGGAFTGPIPFKVASTVIPWISGANDQSSPPAMLAFDPLQANVLYTSTGVGVFKLSPSVSNPTFAVTFSNGSATISGTNSLVANQPIQFFVTGGALPGNFVAGSYLKDGNYYVLATGLSGSQFQVSLTIGGAAVVASGAGSGTMTATGGVTWNGDDTVGIQNIDATTGVSIPNGPMILQAQDRPTWLITDPTTPQANYFPDYTQEIDAGWGWGAYNHSTPATVFGMSEGRGVYYSTSSGAVGTWLGINAYPAGFSGSGFGQLAIYSNSNAVWASANDLGVACLTGGTLTGTPTWSAPTFTNGATSGGGGWNHDVHYNRNILTLDDVDVSTYYLYNNGTGSNAGGVYKSTNGTSFSLVHAGVLGVGDTSANFSIFAVPGKSGELYAAGMVDWEKVNGGGSLPDGNFLLWKSTDHGATWTSVPNIKSLFGFSLGAAMPGNSYPSLYAVGWASTDGGSTYNYGAWRTDTADQATPTWINIGDGFPNGNIDFIKFVAADRNKYGDVYVGFSGSGYSYGRLQ